jgi:hypothetical protein
VVSYVSRFHELTGVRFKSTYLVIGISNIGFHIYDNIGKCWSSFAHGLVCGKGVVTHLDDYVRMHFSSMFLGSLIGVKFLLTDITSLSFLILFSGNKVGHNSDDDFNSKHTCSKKITLYFLK